MRDKKQDKLRKTESKNRNEINRKNSLNNDNDSKRSRKQIFTIGIIIITVGFIIILLSIIYGTFVVSTYTDGLAKKWAEVLDEMLVCTGTTLMTIGAGTALYSYFDFVNYIQEKLKNVIIDYEFTDSLSDENKKFLACKLEKELLYQNEGNNLYDFVQEEVLSLAKKAFYEEFTLNVSCKRVGNEIHKTICKDYIINCESQTDFDIAENNEFTVKYKESCKNHPAGNIKLNINSIDFEQDDYSTEVKNTNDEVYNRSCKYTLNEKAKEKIDKTKNDINWNCKYVVRSEMLSIVKDDDMSFSFRLYYPCKNTTFLFTYNPEEFEVMEDVFVFKDTDIDDTSKKAITTRHNKGSIHVRIDNWVLPGDGITFVMAPINHDKEVKESKEK